MAINPGSDLLSDALAAADPRKAQLATQRLTAIAANGSSPPPSFEATLAEQQGAAKSPANSAANGTASPYAGAPAAQAGPAAQSSAGGAPAGETASPQPQAVPAGNPETPASPTRQVAQNGAQGKAASAYREFETTMLKTLFEAMLPQKANGIYGSGLAGSVWKSMYADALAKASSHANVLGIARNLEAKARHGGSSNSGSPRT